MAELFIKRCVCMLYHVVRDCLVLWKQWFILSLWRGVKSLCPNIYTVSKNPNAPDSSGSHVLNKLWISPRENQLRKTVPHTCSSLLLLINELPLHELAGRVYTKCLCKHNSSSHSVYTKPCLFGRAFSISLFLISALAKFVREVFHLILVLVRSSFYTVKQCLW